MAEIVSMEELRLSRNILGLYRDKLDELTEEERQYVEMVVLKQVVPRVIEKLKKNNVTLNFEELCQKEDFFNLLFDELCRFLIQNSSYVGPTPDKFKEELLQSLYEDRETDKDRLLYDEELYDERPMVSEYEFDLSRILGSISSFVERKLESHGHGKR